MIRRRDFVTHAGSALAMTCVPLTVLAAKRGGGGGASDVDLSTGLSSEKFNALLKESFYVSTPNDGVMVLELVEVQDYAMPDGEIATDSFRLVFEGVSAPTLGDDVYQLQHGSAGSVMLRLEGAGSTRRRARYVGDFCLLM